jgi:hypothetical protein
LAEEATNLVAVMNIIVHTGGWNFGWDSLVAFGTFALAVATGLLAKETADEIASQMRPVLVPAHGAESLTSEYLAKLLRVQIRNSASPVPRRERPDTVHRVALGALQPGARSLKQTPRWSQCSRVRVL